MKNNLMIGINKVDSLMGKIMGEQNRKVKTKETKEAIIFQIVAACMLTIELIYMNVIGVFKLDMFTCLSLYAIGLLTIGATMCIAYCCTKKSKNYQNVS